MSEELTFGGIVDRLRSNLRQAGIRAGEGEIDTMIEMGYLRMVATFERLIADAPSDALPDYLADRSLDTAPRVPEPAGPTGQALPATPPYPAPPGPPTGLEVGHGRSYASLAETAELVRKRMVSPLELVETSLVAIQAHDPVLNAFQLVLAERARSAAQAAESAIARGEYRGPLHGIPVAAKDLLAMAGTVTTAGSRILASEETGFDAAAIERLDAAGAVIVGKTRLSEFAYSPGSNNAHYGPTRNPWNLAHDTGGSSSGSSAAVAGGLVFAALGTDTGGSIRIPASLCGLVGLKPTYGRLSLHGAVTLSWSLDHLGPLTRTVADAAVLLDALAGYDPRDSRTRQGPVLASRDYLERGVRGLRIGVVRDDGSGRSLGTPDTVAAWRAGLRTLEGAGAELVDLDLPEMQALRIVHGELLVIEAAAYHQPMLRARFEQYGPFMRDRVMRAFAHGPTAFVQAQQARATLRRRFNALFEHVDLLSTPTMPYGAPLLNTPATVTFSSPFNLLGWPAISVPVGWTSDGLPLGLQLAGRPWDEVTVLRAARALEAHGPWRSSS